jgi:long-subunit acyl-CoA synthetase (AMP-forming)
MEILKRMNSVVDFLKHNAVNHKSKIAILDETTSLSNSEFFIKIQTASDILKTIGVKKYHKIMMISNNSIDFFVLFFAIKLLGGIPILISTAINNKELTVIVEKSNPNFVFLASQKIERFFDEQIIGTVLTFNYIKTKNLNIDTSLDKTGVMLHTSGTSGNIKVVALSEDNLISGAIKTKKNRAVTEQDVLYLILPATFVFGLNLTLGIFYSSGSVFVANKFKRSHVKSFEKNKISMLSSTPISLSRITSIMEEQQISASSIRYISYGGDALTEERKNYIEKFFNLKLVNGYGMTETTATISINDGTMKGVGKLINGLELKFMLDNKQTSTEGIVYLRGDTIGQGYYESNTSITPYTDNGWFNTGDYGKLVDGDLVLIGRYKDLFLYNSVAYNPVNIENELQKIINKTVIIVQNKENNYVFVKSVSDSDKYRIDNYMKLVYNIDRLIYLNLKKIPMSYNGKIKRNELLKKVLV